MSVEFSAPRAHGSLSSWDDFPIHQAAETVRHATTSDRNFYDRYYFNCHSNDGEALLIFGMGQYPNLAVQDAFAVVVSGDDHRVVRASRELGDRMDTTVGPFRVEVIKPLHELRIVLEDNEHGMAFDLTWTGSIPAFEEPRQYLRKHGRVYFDTMRLAQTGRWSGTIRSSGRTFDVTPESWWGVRDRSWGVRPVGEEEPAGIRTGGQMEGFWNYAPMQFEDHSILYILNEHDRVDANGRAHRELEEAVRIWNDPDREPEWLGRPEHDHVVGSGTRRIERGVIRFPEAPEGSLEIAFEPMLDCYLMYGTGYGLETDWRHGMYQGPLVVQGQTTNYAEIRDSLFGINDQVARFTQSNGAVGHGLHEFFFIGGFERYKLSEWDPAPMSDPDAHAALVQHLLSHSVRTGEFTLKSGRTSSWFIDSKQTACDPDGVVLMAEVALDGIIPDDATAIGGLTVGADPVAYGVAAVAATRGRRLRSFTIRKEAKDHGVTGRLAGPLRDGDRVVITEDTVTRGTSLFEAVTVVRQLGAEVVLIMPLVDRGGTCAAMAAEAGIPYRPLVTAIDLGFTYEGADRAPIDGGSTAAAG